MERSNLRLNSNIYPWDGRWTASDADFIAVIWDEKALKELKIAEGKKECVLTDHQREIFNHAIHCPKLDVGDNPFGWITEVDSESGERKLKKICRCRNERCSNFEECRNGNEIITSEERAIWCQGNRDGIDEFIDSWNSCEDSWGNKTCPIECSKALNEEPLVDVKPIENTVESDPKVLSMFPDDEEFKDVASNRSK